MPKTKTTTKRAHHIDVVLNIHSATDRKLEQHAHAHGVTKSAFIQTLIECCALPTSRAAVQQSIAEFEVARSSA